MYIDLGTVAVHTIIDALVAKSDQDKITIDYLHGELERAAKDAAEREAEFEAMADAHKQCIADSAERVKRLTATLDRMTHEVKTALDCANANVEDAIDGDQQAKRGLFSALDAIEGAIKDTDAEGR